MFKESFLHFIWQYQYFDKQGAKTLSGDSIEVIFPGNHNLHDGPDFKEAKINLGGIAWYGSIEIHRFSSDWYKHKHDSDPNYDNVILHVVWEEDRPVLAADGNPIPVLELKGKIKPGVIRRYKEILESKGDIPCHQVFRKVRAITKLGMLERVLIQRLQEKSEAFLELLKRNNRDWEETAYQWLAKGFGFKTNANAFLQLAQKTPLKVIQKHSNRQDQVEALLYGQAGFLEHPKDAYSKVTKAEYDYLREKYQLEAPMFRAEWTFGRVRPSNHPAIRLSQLSALLCHCPNIFSFFSETSDFRHFTKLFEVKQSAYWTGHFDLGKPAAKMIGSISSAAIENLIVNVTVPFLVALWRDRENDKFLERAQNLLMQLSAEKNSIVEKWKSVGWNVSNAFDSQGLIHLYNNYCKVKGCIECGIGIELIRNKDQRN